MTYVEFPFDRIVSLHVKKKGPPDEGGGGGGGPCTPYYTTSGYLPREFYMDGATLWIQPYYCCPPHYFAAEADYGQTTVWGGGAISTRLTWTWSGPTGGRMGIWLFPHVAPHNWDKLWVNETYPNGTVKLLSPKGEPVLMVAPGILTYDIPIGLTPADVPGAPEADQNIFGTTIILCWMQLDETTGHYVGVYGVPQVDQNATIEVEHNCSGASLTAEIPEGYPTVQRRPRRR